MFHFDILQKKSRGFLMFLGVIYLPHLKTINLVGLLIPDTV